SPLSLPPSLSSLPPLPRPPLFPYTTLFRSQALSSQTHGLFIGGRQQHQKLFPADAANNSCGIRQSLQLTGQLGEHSVAGLMPPADRKSTRLNSSHVSISYAVFCLKKTNEHN